MILFSNPGELDPRLITLSGASIKLGSSPIGRFGSGLKYAIAGLLREGQEIIIYSGHREISFRILSQTIRGQEISCVEMQIDSGAWSGCGFTTELGAHWKPWMLYRELYANALDEDGSISERADRGTLYPINNTTNICVFGPLLDEVHAARDDYFLTSLPLWTLPGVLEVHPPSASLISYQGIRMAADLDRAKTAAYTYNLLDDHDLTEDRTLSNPYHARAVIAQALLSCPHRDLVEGFLSAEHGLESILDYDWASASMSPQFREVAIARVKAKLKLPPSIKLALKRLAPEALEEAEIEPLASSLSAMELEAPALLPKPSRPPDFMSYVTELESALNRATASATYWKRAATHIASAQPDFSNPDLEPFDAL